jgi:LPS-assembly protein
MRCKLSQYKILLCTGAALIAISPCAASAQLLTGLNEPAASATAQQASFLAAPDMPAQSAPMPPPLSTAPSLIEPVKKGEPVRLDAENLKHDEKSGIITASGNVFLVQAGRILRADEMVYDLNTDTAEARGHVVLNEENGTIHYADNVKFSEELKNGFVDQIKVYMSDGGRFTAKNGQRKNAERTVMKDAAYTPCSPCKLNPDAPPAWGLRAAKVTHDDINKRIVYNHARLEVKGVPVAYIPYFSHPDGTVKRKSGLLSPSGGYRSDLGAMLTNRYYWGIAPDQDATIGLTVMSKESPLLTGEYRRRWNNAQLIAQGGITQSGRTDNTGGRDVKQDDETRGHIFANGLWDINDKWRAGTNVAWTSDDQYMRQYDFSDDNVLVNEAYAERFDGRHYAEARLMTFQDLRTSEFRSDQPEILPELYAGFVGDPDSMPVIGGRWEADASFLALRRSGSGQDMSRISLKGAWNRRMVSDYGLLGVFNASARQDIFMSADRMETNSQNEDGLATRFFPQLTGQVSYPMAKPMQKMQAVIEPIVSLTAAPNIDVDDDIPNEDSQDVQIDTSNLFEEDRFPGYDRVEDQSRATYGLRTGLYGYNGGQGEVFLGQSYRFQSDDNPFPSGSGLNNQESDIVGQVSALVGNRYDFNYRFQLENQSLASKRHEVQLTANWDRFGLSGGYLFASGLGGTEINEDREQAKMNGFYYINPEWRLTGSATQDLGDEPGLRRAQMGFDYFGQCFSWSIIAKRNLTDESSGDSGTEISFNIGLKNLGGFMESGYKGAK